MNRSELITALQDFASSLEVTWKGDRRSWKDHTSPNRPGFVDEETLVQPKVFPAFAKRFLDWSVGTDLAPELTDRASTPDFTPDDRVTHRFVFETKGTSEQHELRGHDDQVRKYLRSTSTDRVVFTNMLHVRVFSTDADGEPAEDYNFSLRGLWSHDLETTVDLPDAAQFEKFVAEFSRQELTTDEKIDRIRAAPPWTTLEHTTPDWLRTRLDRVVGVFRDEVRARVAAGALTDSAQVTGAEQAEILTELQGLLVRFGIQPSDAETETLTSILSSNADTRRAAVEQFVSHVAYWISTKLALVRIWEDLGLLNPASLYDGGFDRAMTQFNESIDRVIADAFTQAQHRYRALFIQQHTYSWYRPSKDTAVDGLYELANTYMGEVSSDVLGEVYETMLQRIDRKLLGQYYTPRDVIKMMWDITIDDPARDTAEAHGRSLRTLDIATGSGGFLVDHVVRERRRFNAQVEKGAGIDRQQWINRIADNTVGVEYQRFSAFLAELNLLIQLSQVLSADPDLRIPELGIVNGDTLTLHHPHLVDSLAAEPSAVYKHTANPRQGLADKIKDPDGNDFWFDVAVGNPPYIGEKGGAATLLSRLEQHHPYWDQFKAAHRDYLYAFLILGVSKLRPGGRFAFITTEYWLRATGASPLRQYLALHCQIDRLLLFRDMRLFPDAPGQHNLVSPSALLDQLSAPHPSAAMIASMETVWSRSTRSRSSRVLSNQVW